MNVLHLYSGNLYGGIERLLATFQWETSSLPLLRPAFVLCFEGRLARELRANGASLHMTDPVRFRRPWSVWSARRRLARPLQEADVAICHGPWSHALFAPAVRRAGVPLVFWAHDIHCGRSWLERLAARVQPDLALANSRFTASTLGALFPGTRREVVYLPVARTEIADRGAVRWQARTELGTPIERTVILMATRLERWKGHLVLLKALASLKNLPGWECWIAGGTQRPGEAAYRRALGAEVKRLELADRVQFLGERSDVFRLLSAADIYCQPNTSPEPFGVVFVEALLAGLPIITAATGGAVEIINEDCGILVPPNSAEHLAGAIARLVLDRELRERMGRAGPARAERLCCPATSLARLHDCLAALAKAKAQAG